MAYNLTDLYAASTSSDIVLFANSTVDGLLFGFFIVAIFFIMLYALKNWEFDVALLTASFSCFILSGIAAFGGFVNVIFPLFFLAATAFAGFYIFVVKRT